MNKMKSSLLLTLGIIFLCATTMACECIPEVNSAIVDSSGTTLTVTFNKPMTLVGHGTGWLSKLSSTYAITYDSEEDTNTWIFVITGTVLSTDVLTLQLNDTPIDSLGYDLLPFTDPVENDSTQ